MDAQSSLHRFPRILTLSPTPTPQQRWKLPGPGSGMFHLAFVEMTCSFSNHSKSGSQCTESLIELPNSSTKHSWCLWAGTEAATRAWWGQHWEICAARDGCEGWTWESTDPEHSLTSQACLQLCPRMDSLPLQSCVYRRTPSCFRNPLGGPR